MISLTELGEIFTVDRIAMLDRKYPIVDLSSIEDVQVVVGNRLHDRLEKWNNYVEGMEKKQQIHLEDIAI